MIPGYVFSIDVEADLDEIWEFIATDSIEAANRWIEKLFEAFEALGKMPGMGQTSHGIGYCSGPWARTW